jgi:hypothetical protein
MRFISIQNLQAKTEEELLSLWKDFIGKFNKPIFEVQEAGCTGLLQLSKETERRGLELKEGRLGKLYFEKTQTQLS